MQKKKTKKKPAATNDGLVMIGQMCHQYNLDFWMRSSKEQHFVKEVYMYEDDSSRSFFYFSGVYTYCFHFTKIYHDKCTLEEKKTVINTSRCSKSFGMLCCSNCDITGQAILIKDAPFKYYTSCASCVDCCSSLPESRGNSFFYSLCGSHLLTV